MDYRQVKDRNYSRNLAGLFLNPGRRKDDRKIYSDNRQTIVMNLSLFIILLAFFIILNGITQFSQPKAHMAMDSVHMAFSVPGIRPRFTGTTSQDIAEKIDGQGDAVEMLQETLRSILPNLTMMSEPSPDGGTMMAVRITKNQFEKVNRTLYPLFVRLLNYYDVQGTYGLEITSYVRDVTSPAAQISFDILDGYLRDLEQAGLDRSRLHAVIENGNPAWLMLHFRKGKEVTKEKG